MAKTHEPKPPAAREVHHSAENSQPAPQRQRPAASGQEHDQALVPGHRLASLPILPPTGLTQGGDRQAAPVQARFRLGASLPAPPLIHEAARHGLAGAGGPLPHLDAIQRSFGAHDVSTIRAHADGAAAAGTAAMGADAFAHGNNVAFAHPPSLHTAAHEAAHVIQQRAGVQLAGGIGQPGDRYEQHADAVADLVVQGRSAEALLGPPAPHASPGRAVQRKFRFVGGLKPIWVDKNNRQFTIEPSAKPCKAGLELSFAPEDKLSPPISFIVPASVAGAPLKAIQPDGIVYDDGKGTQRKLDDLTCFTGHADTNALSPFPEIAAQDHQSAYHSTSFLGRISLVPISHKEGGQLFAASELWVQDVKLSNDRPPTKFGADGQRSHTVAWSLLRAALQRLGGQTLDKFIDILSKMFKDLQVPASHGAAPAKTLFDRVQAGITAIGDPTQPRDFSFWQRAGSELLAQYVHAYQLSEAATYADSDAVGHGEPGHMATLRAAEAALKLKPALDEKELAATQKAAVGMLDFKERLGDKIIAEILHHWVNDLTLAFPRLMAAHRAKIIDALKLTPTKAAELAKAYGKDPLDPLAEISGKPVAQEVVLSRGPTATALPPENRSTFVANVVLSPLVSVPNLLHGVTLTDQDKKVGQAQVALGCYRFQDLQIERLDVADDRPNTRFGVLQRSHTVAWTLVRRHLISFQGKAAAALANFALNELTSLKDDIDSPSENKKIGFDAPKEAKEKADNLTQIIADPTGFPLHQWQSLLSELVETYVTLYQLSRSATYSKEERPKGHGEANAIATLERTENILKAGGIPDLKQFFADNGGDILDAAVCLVDAAVATSTLKPANWRIAIEHWLNLLKGKFPLVASLPNFGPEIEKKIAVMEPRDELLAGYKSGLTVPEKTLINLYENAKKEAKTVPEDFHGDLQVSLRLKLAEFAPPDHAKWEKIVAGLKLPKPMMKKWQPALQPYLQNPSRRTVRPVPDAKTIKQLIDDVGKYFLSVKQARPELIQALLDKIKKDAAKDGLINGFVTAQEKAIEKALGEGIDEAVELSAAGTIDNYKEWYDLIHGLLEDSKDVTYQTLVDAIKKKG